MGRDYVAEIESLKQRTSRHFSAAPYEVAHLGRTWAVAEQTVSVRSDFFVIRLVTILEVATRGWIATLIDHGDPYLGRAEALFKRSGVRIDFATAQAITKKRITLGDLLAHTVSTNSVGDIDSALTALLHEDLKSKMQGLKDPWISSEGPIVRDPDETYRMVQRVFECRHIVVHELPADPPYDESEVDGFISHVLAFVSAVDVLISEAIGDTALTQADLNEQSAAKAQEAELKLQAILIALDPGGSDEELQEAQTAWLAYRKAHADYRSGIRGELPGSIAPMIWSSAFEDTTKARIEELEWLTTREEGDL